MKLGVFVQFGKGLPVCKSWRADSAQAEIVAKKFRRSGYTATVFPIYEASDNMGSATNDTALPRRPDSKDAGADN